MYASAAGIATPTPYEYSPGAPSARTTCAGSSVTSLVVSLTPTEVDRLLQHAAAELARRRRERGLRLNVPEATALVADAVVEAARDGRSHAEAISAGRMVLDESDVLPGVADVLDVVHVEAVFDDGSRLVSVADPIGGGHLGDEAPGAVLASANRPAPALGGRVPVTVVNEADVPIAVSSHVHFFEVNPRLRFDRGQGYGRRLAVPAGHTVLFEPGVPTDVVLTAIGGDRVVIGAAGLVDGPLDAPGARDEALRRARSCGYADTVEDES